MSRRDAATDSTARPGPGKTGRRSLPGALLLSLVVAALGIGWTDVDVRFTAIPPRRTTAQGPLELRVAIQHEEASAQTFEVTFLLDGHSIAQQTVSVPADAPSLVAHWRDRSGVVGDHILGYEVRQDSEVIATGGRPFGVLLSDQPGPRFFQAGWIDPGALLPGLYPALAAPTAADLRAKIASMQAVGMDMIIVTYVEAAMLGWGPFYPSGIAELGPPLLSFDAVGTILDEADARGMHVFLGLGRGPGPLTFFPPDLDAIDAAVELGSRVADELVALYGLHPSLYGWYLTHEMNFLQGASLYYDAMGLALDAHGPERPLLVSPSGTPIMDSTLLANSEVDIFAYQDAVGAGYVPYVYTFDPGQRLAMLDAVFASYAALHAGTGKHLWANAECWEMAGPSYGNPYPAPWPRLREQLAIERRHAPVLTTYEFAGFMESADSRIQLGGPLAVDLYTAYRGWLDQLPAPRPLPTGWRSDMVQTPPPP